VGTRVINASKADTVANLQALDPILTRLSEAGANLPGALEMLVTYPFPQAATGAVQGDFTNLRITADLDLRTVLANIGGPRLPDLPKIPRLPTLPPLPSGLPTKLPTGLPTQLPTGLPTGLPITPPPVSVPPLSTPTVSIPGGGGGGPLCPPVCALGAPAPGSAYDMNLAALMMGGYA